MSYSILYVLRDENITNNSIISLHLSHACISTVPIRLCDNVNFCKCSNPKRPPFLTTVNMLKSSCRIVKFSSGQNAPSCNVSILFLFKRNSFKFFKPVRLSPWIVCNSFLFISLQKKYCIFIIIVNTVIINKKRSYETISYNIRNFFKFVKRSFSCVK